jgi:hypothetical protein
MRQATIGPSSRLSLFEAAFKVIEERVLFGRLLVTIMSVLMSAVIIVFCVQYLFVALNAAAIWIIRSIKIGAPVPFSSFPADGRLIQWILLVWLTMLSASTIYVRRLERKLADNLMHYVKQEVLPAVEKFAQASVQVQQKTET